MKLKTYLAAEHLSLADFARSIDRHPKRVQEWASGRKVPSGANLAAIQKATRGKVTALDFVEEKP